MALPTLAPSDPTDTEPSGRPQPKREHILLAAVAVVVLLAGGWFFFLRSSGDSSSDASFKPVARTAAGVPRARVTAPAAGAAAGTAAPAARTTANARRRAPAAAAAAGAQGEVAAYVAKANSICAATLVKVHAIDTSDTSVKGQIAILDQLLPLGTSEIHQLRALAVPAGHTEFAAAYSQDAQIASLLHQARGALNDGNPNTFAQLMAWAAQDGKTVDAAYTAAGLTSCAAS